MKIQKQKTKIVATIGPASRDYDNLLALVRAGVDVFRLNFSHSNHADHAQVIENICSINEQYKTHVGILADLQGPKLRIGQMEGGGVPIKEGDILTFVNEVCVGNLERIYMSYNEFAHDVKVGEKVLVDDGKIELEVVETNGTDTVKLRVLFGGVLSSNKGVNLPDTRVSLPSLTEKDIEDLHFILQYPVNWIALSFVRTPEDLIDLRSRIKKENHTAKIIAKIEKPEALRHLEAIIAATDGVMVARGDLAVEIPMERLPLVQKNIIHRCNASSKPVIVATQMMDSMITNPSPTRAEISDVANAVFDGADAVMLSGETSVGRHPAKVVQAMGKIISEAEKSQSVYYRNIQPDPSSPTYLSDAVCHNAVQLARDINAVAIIGMTTSGYTAFQVSSRRPNCPIFIFSDRPEILNTLNLVWGIEGFFYDKFTTTDETFDDVQTILKALNIAKAGDVIVNTGSMPLKRRSRTNMLKVTRIS